MNKIPNLLVLLLTLITISSCADESGLDKNSGNTAMVKITMQVPQEKNVSTRSLSLSENESTVNNLTVLIFNSDDQLIGMGYVASPTGTNDTYQMSVDTREATNCTIYAVANAGENAFTSGNDTIKGVSNSINTIDEFKAAYAQLSAAADLGSQSNVIMEGVLTAQSISAGTTTLSDVVPLYRLCTKMTFNIQPASDVTVTGYQLHELPLSSYIVDRSGEDTPTYNPAGTYGDVDAVIVSSPTAGTEVIDTSYLYENLAGTVSASSTAKLRNSTNAPATASFLEVYATGSNWKSVYRIYLGGTSSTDYTNYNILRNYNYTYTVSISSSGVYDVRVICYPELINSTTTTDWSNSGDTLSVTSSDTAVVGDYYFSDGTWGTLAERASATVYPIGVIFSGRTSTIDKAHGWTHGYAMALTNAITETGDSCIWSSVANVESGITYQDAVTNQEYVYTDYYGQDYTVFTTNKDGYSESQVIKNSGISGYSSSTYPAVYYALNYGTSVESETIGYAAPSESSGWYLASVGQWYDIDVNLGTMSTTPTASSTNGWCRWYSVDIEGDTNDYTSIAINAINAYLTAISTYSSNKGYSYGTPVLFSNNNIIWGGNYMDVYWLSSEGSSSNAGVAGFILFGNTVVNNVSKNANRFRVRPVIAF